MNINTLTLVELVSALETKSISSVEAVTACFDRIHKTERLNNFITLCEDRALAAAKAADGLIARGATSGMPLVGVPIAVKDNINVSGVRTTCGSAFYYGFTPDTDAAVVKRLVRSGAIVIGKTNMDELAMGSTNKSSAFGHVKNALDEKRVPGGSSGGSANCVAAFQAFAALGTDTGGSIRQPAAYCGVVGLKPTFGNINTDGLMGLAGSLDTIGTLTRTVDDATIVYNAITGKSGGAAPRGEVRGKKIGISKQFFNSDIADDAVLGAFESAVMALEKAGAKIVNIDLDSFKATLPTYHILSSAEAAANILRESRGDALRMERLGAEVVRRIMTGLYVTNDDNYDDIYMRAACVRAAVKRDYERALDACDFIVSPTAPSVATLIDEESDPVKTHGGDYFLAGVSLAGLPAVSVPCGTVNGLPIGLQIIGRANSECEILNAAKAVE